MGWSSVCRLCLWEKSMRRWIISELDGDESQLFVFVYFVNLEHFT